MKASINVFTIGRCNGIPGLFMMRVTMKNYPCLLYLHVYSDLKRKEFFSLLHSNSDYTMRLENGETPNRIREYSCRIEEHTNEDGSLLDIVLVSSVMAPSRGRWKRPSTQRSR